MIHTVASTGSTNADLAARLRAGEVVREGEWLVADRQTAGRGRLGRDWIDGAGNFMGSTVVRAGFGSPPASSVPLLAGLAVHAALTPFLPDGHRALLKWPNDVLVDGAKIAGILVEGEGDALVAGIGVNLATAPELAGRRTIALAHLASAPSRDAFAEALSRCFAEELERWRCYGLEALISRWLAAAHPIGTPLKTTGEELSGTFAGLTPDGALQLRLADGSMRTIHAGEINLSD